jgi:hypothetical protein
MEVQYLHSLHYGTMCYYGNGAKSSSLLCISLFTYRYILLKKAVNRTDYMALNGKTGNELEGMWKERHLL